MAEITVEELDLLGFFCVEPKRLDPDVPWPYNDFAYEVERGGLSLSFSVAPAYKDVRIIITLASETVYELNAVDVEDVKYHKEGVREALEVVVTSRDSLWLRIWPTIIISHQVSDDV